MTYAAAQFALFEEPDDYVIENNPDVTYDNVLNKYDFNLFQDEEQLYYKSLSDFNLKLVKKAKEKKIQQHVDKPKTKDEAYQRCKRTSTKTLGRRLCNTGASISHGSSARY